MNFEQAFDQSYERVLVAEQEGKGFFTAFYLNFLGASDEVQEKFRDTDMERQQRMLKKSFYSLLTFYASNQTDHVLEQIARNHSRSHLDIRPELYDLWLEQLIITVAKFDAQFNDRVELAWRLVLAPGITYMKFHYDKGVLEEQ